MCVCVCGEYYQKEPVKPLCLNRINLGSQKKGASFINSQNSWKAKENDGWMV